MSDPFWKDLDAALPRARRGEPGWARLRAATMTRLKGSSPLRRAAGPLVLAGTLAAAVFVLRARRAAPADEALRAVPGVELEFLEDAPILEDLDVLLDAKELDKA